MKMKHTIVILLLVFFSSLASAQEKPTFNIEPEDVQKIEIDLIPEKSIQVRVYFSSLEKVKEFQKIQKENYRKAVLMQVNGQTVSEVTMMFEAPYIGSNTAFSFSNMNEALELVYSLMPDRRPIQ